MAEKQNYQVQFELSFLQSENTSCPTLINAYITEETLYIGLHRNESMLMVQVMATLCFYELQKGSLVYTINSMLNEFKLAQN